MALCYGASSFSPRPSFRSPNFVFQRCPQGGFSRNSALLRLKEFFERRFVYFTAEEKKEWLKNMTDVALGSDAFFPFGDNIERAGRSGVKYVAQPGGSIRDDLVIESADKYGSSP